MRIGIDLSNIRVGGGVTHIVELLNTVQSEAYGIEHIIVWSGKKMLELLPVKPWLQVMHEPMLDQPLPVRTYWQVVILPRLAEKNCDILFLPGGHYGGNFRPFVTMSQNLLPFETKEMQRYGISWMYLRLFLLKSIQTRSFRKADGVIFLSEYARAIVMKKTKGLNGISTVIPHGISKRFFQTPRMQKPKINYSQDKPFRLLYVSTVDVYKHQWQVVEAVSILRQYGYPITLDLVGPAYAGALRLLEKTLRRNDPERRYNRYHGDVPHEQVVKQYHQADAFVFASTCETFGQILLEAMASGLPIACSNCRPMSDLLSDAGVYFDPEQPREIANALKRLFDDGSLRQSLAHKAYERAKEYSWKQCAHEAFSFITKVKGYSEKRRQK